MSKVYSKTRLNSDGHGSLVSEISGPKATTLAWPKEAPWGLGGPAGLPSRPRGLGAQSARNSPPVNGRDFGNEWEH
jgi:hypothetical protein